MVKKSKAEGTRLNVQFKTVNVNADTSKVVQRSPLAGPKTASRRRGGQARILPQSKEHRGRVGIRP